MDLLVVDCPEPGIGVRIVGVARFGFGGLYELQRPRLPHSRFAPRSVDVTSCEGALLLIARLMEQPTDTIPGCFIWVSHVQPRYDSRR